MFPLHEAPPALPPLFTAEQASQDLSKLSADSGRIPAKNEATFSGPAANAFTRNQTYMPQSHCPYPLDCARSTTIPAINMANNF